ncbi:YSC84-related protein [uncultured Vibrio sp.]|uniref:YSC84-related protein n=1 Tax=uncultured Vibrio sp. TaxID=114054 RepID=UPI0026358A45|nr:YSC84-related protein [uncultured Vibrio sp.]
MRKLITTILASIAFIAGPAMADDYSDTIKSFQSNPEIRQAFNSAYGYAVFPTIGKGGLGIGGAHGKGKVYQQGTVIGQTKMSQISFGLQAGGQAYSQVIFFENKAALDKFTSGQFEFGAGANAIAITASAQAQTGTTGTSTGAGTSSEANDHNIINYTNGMVVLTAGKGGLMYEASIAGQKYSFKAQ